MFKSWGRRPHAYVALTRSTTINLAYVFTLPPKRADPAPGPRPAPELDCYDQIHTERTGPSALATPPAPTADALAVLAAVLKRDGQLRSATQDRHRALTDADHLAIPARHLDRRDRPGPRAAARDRDVRQDIQPAVGDRGEGSSGAGAHHGRDQALG